MGFYNTTCTTTSTLTRGSTCFVESKQKKALDSSLYIGTQTHIEKVIGDPEIWIGTKISRSANGITRVLDEILHSELNSTNVNRVLTNKSLSHKH